MGPFDELREIINQTYGNLNLLEIEDADYTHVLNRLKQIIDDFTQSAPQYQQDLRERIKQVESIETLSSISLADMNNLKKIVPHTEALVKNNIEFQKSQSEKIDKISQLSLDLKKWSESKNSQNMSQEEIDKIAEAVSANLNLKLNFDDVNVSTKTENELKTHDKSILQPLNATHSRPKLGMLLNIQYSKEKVFVPSPSRSLTYPKRPVSLTA